MGEQFSLEKNQEERDSVVGRCLKPGDFNNLGTLLLSRSRHSVARVDLKEACRISTSENRSLLTTRILKTKSAARSSITARAIKAFLIEFVYARKGKHVCNNTLQSADSAGEIGRLKDYFWKLPLSAIDPPHSRSWLSKRNASVIRIKGWLSNKHRGPPASTGDSLGTRQPSLQWYREYSRSENENPAGVRAALFLLLWSRGTRPNAVEREPRHLPAVQDNYLREIGSRAGFRGGKQKNAA